jgi:hypothetical protein
MLLSAGAALLLLPGALPAKTAPPSQPRQAGVSSWVTPMNWELRERVPEAGEFAPGSRAALSRRIPRAGDILDYRAVAGIILLALLVWRIHYLAGGDKLPAAPDVKVAPIGGHSAEDPSMGRRTA